jgi:competence protein ComEC
LDKEKTPFQIRLNYKQQTPLIRVGDTLSGYAHLVPPILPAQEGAYDFSRTAWFMRVGALGRLSEISQYQINPNRSELSIWFEDIRSFISNRIQTILAPDAAAIVVPLIIGD